MQDGYDNWQRQQEVWQLLQAVVHQKADVPVMRLDVAVRERDQARAPLGSVAAGEFEPRLRRLVDDGGGKLHRVVWYAKEGPSVALEQQKREEAEGSPEDGPNGRKPAHETRVEEEASRKESVRADQAAQREEDGSQVRPVLLQEQKTEEADGSEDGFTVAGAEEDGRRVEAEKEDSLIGLLLGEELVRQPMQRNSCDDEERNIDQDAAEDEDAVTSQVCAGERVYQAVGGLANEPRVEREEGQGLLVGVAVLGNVQEVLAVPTGEPSEQPGDQPVAQVAGRGPWRPKGIGLVVGNRPVEGNLKDKYNEPGEQGKHDYTRSHFEATKEKPFLATRCLQTSRL